MKLRICHPWSAKHLAILRKLWAEKSHLGTHKRATLIGMELGRTRETVYATARRIGLVGNVKASLAKHARQARLVRLFRASMQG